MISQSEVDHFYHGLVTDVRARGGMCAITSGMACVQYRVAQSTQDCDLLCLKSDARSLLEVLQVSTFGDSKCSYRGNLTAPLDERWLVAGRSIFAGDTLKARLTWTFSVLHRAAQYRGNAKPTDFMRIDIRSLR